MREEILVIEHMMYIGACLNAKATRGNESELQKYFFDKGTEIEKELVEDFGYSYSKIDEMTKLVYEKMLAERK